MDLSVIVGSVESGRSIDECLDALGTSCRGLDVEIIVADASTDDTRSRVERRSDVTLVELPPGTLVPDLWAEGIRRSRGRYVALTTGHCIVPPNWPVDLVDALRNGADGAGAGLALRPEAGLVDRAVFYLRYSSFLRAHADGSAEDLREIPGDNAAYVGDALRTFVSGRRGGFWEIEYHRWLRSRGGKLRWVPTATAGFGRSFPLATIVRHRFAHGRHFGRWRVEEEGDSVWRVCGAAPVVPPVLLLRTIGRVLRATGHLGSFLAGLPAFVPLTAAWAFGEAMGAVEAHVGHIGES